MSTHFLSAEDRGRILVAIQMDPDDNVQAAVVDCLADLMAVCEAEGLDFDALVPVAREWRAVDKCAREPQPHEALCGSRAGGPCTCGEAEAQEQAEDEPGPAWRATYGEV